MACYAENPDPYSRKCWRCDSLRASDPPGEKPLIAKHCREFCEDSQADDHEDTGTVFPDNDVSMDWYMEDGTGPASGNLNDDGIELLRGALINCNMPY